MLELIKEILITDSILEKVLKKITIGEQHLALQ